MSYNLAWKLPHTLCGMSHAYHLMDVYQLDLNWNARNLNILDNTLFKKVPYLLLLFIVVTKNSIQFCLKNETNVLFKNCVEQNLPIINSKKDFYTKFEKHFGFSKWSHYIDWQNYFVAGGSILTCLRKDFVVKPEQDVDFFSFHVSDIDFFNATFLTMQRLMKEENLKVKLELGYHHPDAFTYVFICLYFLYFQTYTSRRKRILGGYLHIINFKVYIEENKIVKFQFIRSYLDRPRSDKWMTLSEFDLNCCQVGWDGKNVLCTPAFIHANTTNHVINYKLNPEEIKFYAKRILKYTERNISFLAPHGFQNGDCLKTLYKSKTLPNSSERDYTETYLIAKKYNHNGDYYHVIRLFFNIIFSDRR